MSLGYSRSFFFNCIKFKLNILYVFTLRLKRRRRRLNIFSTSGEDKVYYNTETPRSTVAFKVFTQGGKN